MSLALRARALTATVRRAPAPALLFVSVVGWSAMIWMTASSAAEGVIAPGGLAIEGGHAGHATDAATRPAWYTATPHGPAMWTAMVLAMSPLLLLREVARVWRSSLRRRRGGMILVFALGYGLVWMLAGMLAVPVADVLTGSVGLTWVAVALVIAWQCSPLRQRLLNVCHRSARLRVFGAAAQGDAWRYGVRTGGACAASCAPVMVLVLLATDLHLVAMVGATVPLTIERYRSARRPQWRLPFLPQAPEHLTLG
jgi:Predicted metal-binding integral membrane protein (DUF2182)